MLSNCLLREGKRILCIVGVQKDHVLVLHSDEVIRFPWLAPENATIQGTCEEGLQKAQEFRLDIF